MMEYLGWALWALVAWAAWNLWVKWRWVKRVREALRRSEDFRKETT